MSLTNCNFKDVNMYLGSFCILKFYFNVGIFWLCKLKSLLNPPSSSFIKFELILCWMEWTEFSCRKKQSSSLNSETLISCNKWNVLSSLENRVCTHVCSHWDIYENVLLYNHTTLSLLAANIQQKYAGFWMMLQVYVHNKMTVTTYDGSEKLWRVSFVKYEDVNNPLGPPYNKNISHCVESCKTSFAINLGPLDILKCETKRCYKL
jgi:hypothetical protein